MTSTIIILIVGMMVVTYVPRLLPFLVLDVNSLHPKVKIFLRSIPFAALGALIFPAGVSAVDGNLLISTAGLVVAAVAALLSRNLLLSVALSVLSVVGMIYFRG